MSADALFNLSRGTASAASMGSAAGLAGIVNSFPLMTQRALKTLCGDILEMYARQAILAERHAGDSEKPDALLRLEKVIDDTRLRVVEMCGERGAEVLAVLDQPEVRARVRVAREEEAVTEDEARVARRRQLRMFNRRSNGGNFSSVSHGVNTSSGQNTAWNEKEADTLSYYQRQQRRHGRGRRGSTAVAGGFKQLWAKNKQKQAKTQASRDVNAPPASSVSVPPPTYAPATAAPPPPAEAPRDGPGSASSSDSGDSDAESVHSVGGSSFGGTTNAMPAITEGDVEDDGAPPPLPPEPSSTPPPPSGPPTSPRAPPPDVPPPPVAMAAPPQNPPAAWDPPPRIETDFSRRQSMSTFSTGGSSYAFSVQSDDADALFNLSRGTASAASQRNDGSLASIVNSFPLMTQRALKTLCGDILEMYARQAILAERHAGDSEKPDALLRLEKVIDDTRLRVVEMCGERGAEVLAVLDQPEVRARVRIAREEEAVTEDEARVARRRQLRMFNRRSNGGNSSVSHSVNTSSGQNTAWNEKEADTLSYYQRQQKRHGRGRRGSTAVAGGFKQLWAKNKQKQQQKQQQEKQESSPGQERGAPAVVIDSPASGGASPRSFCSTPRSGSAASPRRVPSARKLSSAGSSRSLRSRGSPRRRPDDAVSVGGSTYAFSVQSDDADALFSLSRGTASAASQRNDGSLAAIVNSFPLMTQRALKTLCGDILEMYARQAILAERHAGDSEKPDALLRLEKVIDDTRLRVVEMCGERGAEVLAVLDQPEVRARVRVAREEEAVTEDEARVARRRQLRMFNRRSNGGNFSSVSHGVNTSSGQNTVWNEKEADTLSYYQRLQKRHGRGRRGSTAVAGGFKQLWAKNKQKQQQKQQQQHSPASVLTASDSQGPMHSNNQDLQSPGSSPVAASDGGGHGFPSPLPQYPATRQLQSRPNATNSPLQLQVGQPGDAAGAGHDSVDGGSVATAGGAEAGPPEGGYRGADVLRAGIPDDDAMFVDAQEAAYQLESGNLQPLRALVFKLRGRLGTLKHDSATLTRDLRQEWRQGKASEHERLKAAIASVSPTPSSERGDGAAAAVPSSPAVAYTHAMHATADLHERRTPPSDSTRAPRLTFSDLHLLGRGTAHGSGPMSRAPSSATVYTEAVHAFVDADVDVAVGEDGTATAAATTAAPAPAPATTLTPAQQRKIAAYRRIRQQHAARQAQAQGHASGSPPAQVQGAVPVQDGDGGASAAARLAYVPAPSGGGTAAAPPASSPTAVVAKPAAAVAAAAAVVAAPSPLGQEYTSRRQYFASLLATPTSGSAVVGTAPSSSVPASAHVPNTAEASVTAPASASAATVAATTTAQGAPATSQVSDPAGANPPSSTGQDAATDAASDSHDRYASTQQHQPQQQREQGGGYQSPPSSPRDAATQEWGSELERIAAATDDDTATPPPAPAYPPGSQPGTAAHDDSAEAAGEGAVTSDGAAAGGAEESAADLLASLARLRQRTAEAQSRAHAAYMSGLQQPVL